MAGVLGIYGLIIAVIIANAVHGVEGGRPAYGYLCALHTHTCSRPPYTQCCPPARCCGGCCRAAAGGGCKSRPQRQAYARLAHPPPHLVSSRSSAVAHFGGGLACGLSGLAAGMAIGIVGDSLTRASAEQPKLFVGMVLILIFAEALGLYGLIVGLILASKA